MRGKGEKKGYQGKEGTHIVQYLLKIIVTDVSGSLIFVCGNDENYGPYDIIRYLELGEVKGRQQEIVLGIYTSLVQGG